MKVLLLFQMKTKKGLNINCVVIEDNRDKLLGLRRFCCYIYMLSVSYENFLSDLVLSLTYWVE